MKSKKITALVAGATIAGSVLMYAPIMAHATTVKHVDKPTVEESVSPATATKISDLHTNVTKSVTKTTKETTKDASKETPNTKPYTLANSGLQMEAVSLKTGKVIATTPKQKADAAQSFAVTFNGYPYETQYNKYHLHQLKNQNDFHSQVQENLYNYMLNPNNRWNTEKEAMELHGDNGSDDCAYFVSSALRAVGVDIPYSTANCWTLQNNLNNLGWVKMFDFSQLRAGDICFAGTDGDAHTFIFMGWANQANQVAWIADSQAWRFGNNMHVRGTFNYPGIDSTVFFYGGPGADIDGIGANTNASPQHLGLKAFGVGVTTSYSNVRSGPGTGYGIIGNFANGTPVQIFGETNGWYKVNFNGGVGYVYSSNVYGNTAADPNNINITNPEYTSPQYPAISTGTVTSYTWAMPNSNWDGNNITTFNKGQQVTITGYSEGSGQQGGWYRVNYQNGSVWIPAVLLNTPIQGQQYATVSNGIVNNLNNNYTWVTGAPNNWNEHIGNLNNGTPVKITGEKDGWYRIDYMQTSAWVPKDRLDNPANYPATTVSEVGAVNTNSTAKNIPNSYGYFNYNIEQGTHIKITGEWNNWYRFDNNGTTEWIPKSDVNLAQTYNVIGEGMVEFPSYGGSCVTNGPSWSSGVQTLLNDNTVVKIIGQKDGWFQVELPNYETGWLPRTRVATDLNASIMDGVGTSNMFTDVQAGPSWTSGTVGTLPNNSYVNIKSQKDGWYEIYYGSNGGTAWVEGNRLNTSLNTNMKTLKTGTIDFSGGTFTSLSYGPSWNCDYAGTLNNGTSVQIVGESGDWYRINNGSSTAWVLKDRVLVNSSKVLGTGVVTFPSLGYTDVETLPQWGNYKTTVTQGTKVSIIGENGNWFNISYDNGKTGWIAKERVATTLNKYVVGTGLLMAHGSYMNVMSSHSWGSTVIGSIPTNTPVNIYGVKDGWFEIYFNGSYGWVPGTAINTSVDPSSTQGTYATINFNAGYTWLMSGPSWFNTNHAGNLNNGTKVQIVNEQNGWYEVTCNKLTAWVQKDRVSLL